MDQVKLGIVGFGIMGERLVRSAFPHPAVRLVGVWDPSPEAAARLEATELGAPMLEDAGAVIAACDALYIAAPPAAHLPLARAAIRAGRSVLLEKPLATDREDGAAFVAEVERDGARAAVNFPMASSPAVAQLAAWREAGAVGAPRQLHISAEFGRWPRGWQQEAASWLARREEGGFTREVVSHFLFLTRRQLGPLELLAAQVEYPAGGGSETAVTAELRAGGVPVRLSGSVGRIAADEANSWTLTGEAGSIRLRDWSYAERLDGEGKWQAAPDALPNPAMRPHALRAQMEKLAALTRGEPQNLATPREAFEVQDLVERILAA
ncbi:Gfo/Idh/MocA family oxidoreductase [Roseomonas sp. M0104]|uniref:Gfo/Idh/MocA family oxidoreductase n=1 Tax=Teichococcus coralli TaxID=2545983 RepID=A0A845BBF6_9PROT|nr:Gfo/Idh/MocA family oxidoreductase [Pseudoroseomonas coralli]MXP63978.1 Gfo/Idh/MocA family oxidoreductase [Pseudoroseomonas coralli]